MLIRCPTCASGYELDPELLTEGRILRCANCRDAWAHSARLAAVLEQVGADDARSATPPDLVTEARFGRRAAADSLREPRMRTAAARFGMWERAGRGLRHRAGPAAAIAALLGIVGGGMAAVAAKEKVVAAFPPSAALFSTLGLPVNLRGLALGEIRSTVETGDGPPTLTLEGHITNLQPGRTAVPAIRIAVRDRSQRELYYWTVPAPKPRLDVGETVLFRSRLSAPPRDGQDLVVSFAEPSVPARSHVAEVLAGDR